MDDYIAIIDQIRRDAAERPAVRRWKAMSCPDASVVFDVLDDTNEPVS